MLHRTSMLGAWRRYGPTCGFATSPKLDPEASIGTPNMGYPLLLGLGETLMAIHSHGLTISLLQLRVWAQWSRWPLGH
jgi:hypothetical protein